jgi:hypothetical protein
MSDATINLAIDFENALWFGDKRVSRPSANPIRTAAKSLLNGLGIPDSATLVCRRQGSLVRAVSADRLRREFEMTKAMEQ